MARTNISSTQMDPAPCTLSSAASLRLQTIVHQDMSSDNDITKNKICGFLLV